jgi:amino acid adenylation domain-containing protein
MSELEVTNFSGLSAEERELLDLMLAEEGVELETTPRIARRPEGREELPLSFAQQRLWFLELLQPGTPVYNISSAVRLNGSLQLGALRQTLNEIVRRHEVLRACFPAVQGLPVQRIARRLELALPLIDLVGVADGQRVAQELAARVAQIPFDLEHGPLLRACVLRLGERDHVALLVVHHVVSDGWSTGILTREIGVLYDAFSHHRPSPLPPLPIQYPDFAIWQREYLQGELLERQLSYWRGQLAGIPELLDLPTDRPRPAMRTARGQTVVGSLPRSLAEAVRELSERAGVSPFMLILAVFQALLHRSTGQEDIMVGTPIANRHYAEIEVLVGFFVNTLVMRANLAGDPAFVDLLTQVRETALEAYAHQDLPFERLVEELQPSRNLSHTPLFQVSFVYQNIPRGRQELSEVSLAPLDFANEVARFDLTLAVEDREEGLIPSFEYSTDLFDASTVLRLLGQLGELLSGVASSPGLRLSELPLLSAGERWQVLGEWNDTGAVYGGEPTLDRLLEAQAWGSADSPAVVFEERSLSYAELHAAANRLARRLRRLGVGPESRVGVCLERSPELVVALVGVIKSGGAYVPLDPSSPSARLRGMLADASPAVLIRSPGVGEELSGQGVRELLLGAGGEDLSGESAEAPEAWAQPESLAYGIYTSGSTGQPKGALVPHRGIRNRLLWMQRQYGLTPADRVLQKTPFSFDVSVWEFFWPLLVGARLVVARPGGHQDGSYLVELIEREGVTVVHFVPSMLQAFLQEPDVERCASLRLLVCSGEALPVELARRCHQRLAARLENLYGPTEASVDVTSWPCEREAERTSIPIGRPIGNVGVRVLGRSQELVGVGIVGEVYLAGVGLGRGYLSRPELTAERFVPDPYGGAGERLYRTGDLGRLLGDGAVEYLGRVDHQVKIRGFRIELGEIESVLLRLVGVAEAAVLALGPAGDRRLVAYLSGREVPRPTVEELRESLRLWLPEYMVPALFVWLEALPLSPSGKVDRRALPAPDGLRPELAQGYLAPRNETEELLAGIWSRILNLDRAGVHDNFFALGGDSIRSIQVLALARERGLSFTLQDVFRHQTIAALGGHLQHAGAAAPPQTSPFSLVGDVDRRRIPEGVEDAYPLSMLQAGMIYHIQLMPEHPLFHNVNAWRLRGRFEAGVFREAVQAVVNRHSSLRTGFAMDDFSEPLQLVYRDVTLPVGVTDLRHLSAAEQDAMVDAFAGEEERRRFDLFRPPLIRFHVHLCGDDTFHFTLAENHVIADGWSLHSTLNEIFDEYLERLAGRTPAEHSVPSTSFREFIYLERQALRSEATQRYWKEKLRDCSPTEIPRWPFEIRPASAIRIRDVAVAVEPHVVAGLQRLANQAAVPFKDVLLAVHMKVLSLICGTSDVMTGLICNGRPEESGGEEIRGLFLNAVPYRMQMSPGTWTDLAQGAFNIERDLLPHRRYPLPAIQREWGRRRLLETDFTYIHFHVVEGVLGSGNIQVIDGGGRVEQTDMPLSCTFDLTPVTANLGLSLRYDTAEFGREQVEEIAGYYLRALAAAARDPQGAHQSLCLLSPSEQQLILREWNDTSTGVLERQPVIDAIESRAAQLPEGVALRFETGEMTYRELNSRANQVAHLLLARGVAMEALVAICAERSPELVIALLAVLKTGAGYLPLDPSYPRERLAWMFEDTGASLVLVQQKLLEVLPATQAERIVLDADPRIAQQPTTDPARWEDGAAAAYVMYTSGSTGRPKGVVISRRTVADRIGWMQHLYGLSETDRLLHKSAFSFDNSVWELLWPLSAGAQVVLSRPGGQQDPAYLRRLILEAGVTFAHFVPSLLEVFLRESEIGGLASLRHVLSGGEPLPIDVYQRLLERLPAGGFNQFGATELCINALRWACLPGSFVQTTVPIGRPNGDTEAYVLDAHLLPVPIGAPGELYVGGRSLARGYLKRPELTAERFVPNPYGMQPGGRLYRSGDQVRQRPDGNLEYLGRTDFLLKVRGFRVEPGEIEVLLREHAGVAEAVVVAREHAAGDVRLVAYVVPAQQLGPAPDELRVYLRERLPDYMVPGVFVTLEVMPRTPSGKVDRRELPAPDLNQEALTESFVAPRTSVEEILAGIWAALLGRERIGLKDDFFDLGGHSLLATQLMSRLRETFEVEVPLRIIFETPSLEALARAIEDGLRTGGGVEVPPVTRVPRGGPLPLSFAQQRLWFLDQLAPGNSAYHIFESVELSGHLNVPVLQASLDEIVRRHEALRTSFPVHQGEPVQRIASPGPVLISQVDLSALAPGQRQQEAGRVAAVEVQRPFDLAAGPLVRAALLRLSDRDHVMVLTMHHIVSDGWSRGVLVAEFVALYSALIDGRPSRLPELSIQYADFAVWQRGWLTDDVLEAQLSYWREQLAGTLPVLQLPTDRPRSAVQTFRGGRESLRFPGELSQALGMFCRRRGLTAFMALLAGFKAVLARHSGQYDVIVGSPIAGRTRLETEPLIGFFVNTLALRTDLDEDPPFDEVLGRVRTTALGAYANQDLPFEKLVEELQPERALSHPPIFQVSCVYVNALSQSVELPQLTLQPFPIGEASAMFDLTLFLSDGEQGLTASAEYNTDLFDPATLTRFLHGFEILLTGVVEDSERPLSAMPLLAPAELHSLLVEANDTRDAARRGLAHRLILEQVASRPGEPAVLYGAQSLTFGELGAQAGRLAGRLRALGIGQGSLVGLYLERSPEMVVAILATLEAGGAYLPLDPSYPAERIAFMLEDARPGVLLAQQALAGTLSPGDVPVVWVDAFTPAAETEPEGEVSPDDLAYVIYTSGSTGVPKGVMVTHRGLANYLAWCIPAYRFAENGGSPVHSPIGFDLTVTSLLAPLAAGRSVTLVPEDAGIEGLLSTLSGGGSFGVVKITPSHLDLLDSWLPAAPAEPAAPRVGALVVGGEALRWDSVASWLARSPATRIINEYGPTETVVGCCTFEVSAARAAGPVPIGRPIANTRLYGLDRYLRPVPSGAAGELYVAGEGVARGYLKRADQTAERFIPDPFDEHGGGRLYRTGDLVRSLPDGALEYLGRIDQQVKIRGFRIELGEIEAALRRHAAVLEAVVMARQEGARGLALVAYVIPAPGAEPTLPALRDHLRRLLPEHMVPPTLLLVASPPLTSHGKVDRRALSRVWAEPAAEGEAPAGPRNILEAHLLRIWEEVLERDRIGIHQDFFALGGHSILAVRVLARVRSELGYELPLSIFFQAPTIESLAGAIRYQTGFLATPLVAIRAEGTRPPLFCVHPSGGGVICYLPLTAALGPDQPVYGLESRLRDRPFASLEEMAAHYVAAIREVRPQGPYCLLGWSYGGLVAFEMARQLRQSAEEVPVLAIIDTLAPGSDGASAADEPVLDLQDPLGLARALEESTGRDLPISPEELQEQGGLKEQMRFILAEARRLHIVPPEIELDEVLRHVQSYNDRIRIGRRYRPAEPFPGPVLLVRSQEADPSHPAEVQADPALGWSRFAPGLESQVLPGSHHTIIGEPYVGLLAERLIALIDANSQTKELG